MTEAAFKAAMLQSLGAACDVSEEGWGTFVVNPEFHRIHEANFAWVHAIPGGVAEVLDRLDVILGPYRIPFRSVYLERETDVATVSKELGDRGFRLIRNLVMVSRRPPELTANPDVSVRPARDQATRDDHDGIAGLLHEESGYDFEVSEQLSALHWRRVAALGGEVFVAYLGGEPAGNCGLYVVGATGLVYNLETVPSLRRRGVAATLVRHVLDRAKALGVSPLALDTPASDTAWKMYERLGFERVGSVVNFLWTPSSPS